MKNLLVWFHVLSGSLAVAGMLVAWFSVKGGKWHRRGGKAYVFAMAGALVMATVIALLTRNLFLLLVGIFSAYLIFTGWRTARIRDGVASRFDQISALLMLGVAATMVGFGVWMLIGSNTLGVALIAFAVFGGGPAWEDWRRSSWPTGKQRIVLHLNRMGGGTIATLTAVFVVNVKTDPVFIAWLLPTIVVVPLLVYFSRRYSAVAATKR